MQETERDDDRLVSSTEQRGPVSPDAAAARLWEEVLDFLRLRVSREGFDTWLAPTKARSLAQDVLEVEVPNSFFADWLGQHYAGDIQSALSAVAGRGVSVRFRTGRDGNGVSSRQRVTVSGPRPEGARLQARYTFDSFVVGESNRLAFAASRSVSENLGRTYNPLFIYGGVGLGKTHLLQAIGNHCLSLRGNIKIHYAAAETVFIELIQAIEHNTRLEFKSKYRVLDLLLLDDIHYLVGKDRLQDEIFHIFNHLHDSGSQIVFTSDRPPRDIPTLEERLVSRLGSGLVVDIQAPDIETRMAILRRRASLENVELPEDVCLYIATRIRTNVRALEGSLVRLLAVSSLDSKPLSVEVAETALIGIVPPETPVDHNRVLSAVADCFGVPVDELRGPRRTKQFALARQTAMYIMRQVLSLSLKEIGYYCGGKDHTTVMHAIGKITGLRNSDPVFAQKIDALVKRIKS